MNNQQEQIVNNISNMINDFDWIAFNQKYGKGNDYFFVKRRLAVIVEKCTGFQIGSSDNSRIVSKLFEQYHDLILPLEVNDLPTVIKNEEYQRASTLKHYDELKIPRGSAIKITEAILLTKAIYNVYKDRPVEIEQLKDFIIPYINNAGFNTRVELYDDVSRHEILRNQTIIGFVFNNILTLEYFNKYDTFTIEKGIEYILLFEKDNIDNELESLKFYPELQKQSLLNIADQLVDFNFLIYMKDYPSELFDKMVIRLANKLQEILNTLI